MNELSAAESAGALLPAARRTELTTGQLVFYAVVDGILSLGCCFFLLRLALDATIYWKTVLLDSSTKLGSFTGTALVLLLPVLWLSHALYRRKWRQVCGALFLLMLLGKSGGDIYRREWRQAEAQEAAFDALILALPEHLQDETLIDTVPITEVTFGPYVHIATVLAEQLNRQTAAAGALDRGLTACGIDQQLFAPETLATPAAVAAMRRKLARGIRLANKHAAEQKTFLRGMVAALQAAEAPPKFKEEFISGMMEVMRTEEVHTTNTLAALLKMLEACKDLYDYMDTQQGNYAVVDGALEFSDPATGIAYIRLLGETEARSKEYLRLCQEVETDLIRERDDFAARLPPAARRPGTTVR